MYGDNYYSRRQSIIIHESRDFLANDHVKKKHQPPPSRPLRSPDRSEAATSNEVLSPEFYCPWKPVSQNANVPGPVVEEINLFHVHGFQLIKWVFPSCVRTRIHTYIIRVYTFYVRFPLSFFLSLSLSLSWKNVADANAPRHCFLFFFNTLGFYFFFRFIFSLYTFIYSFFVFSTTTTRNDSIFVSIQPFWVSVSLGSESKQEVSARRSENTYFSNWKQPGAPTFVVNSFVL